MISFSSISELHDKVLSIHDNIYTSFSRMGISEEQNTVRATSNLDERSTF